MATFLTHPLFGTGAAYVISHPHKPAKKFVLLSTLCQVLPDIDTLAYLLPISERHPLGHRGLAHSGLFAALVAVLVMHLCYRGVPRGGATVAWGLLYEMSAPVLLRQFAAAHMAVLATLLLITVYWKISVHSAGVAGVATLVFSVLGAPVYAIPPVVLVGWSRIYLKRHTFMQVLVGGILGMVVFLLLLSTG